MGLCCAVSGFRFERRIADSLSLVFKVLVLCNLYFLAFIGNHVEPFESNDRLASQVCCVKFKCDLDVPVLCLCRELAGCCCRIDGLCIFRRNKLSFDDVFSACFKTRVRYRVDDFGFFRHRSDVSLCDGIDCLGSDRRVVNSLVLVACILMVCYRFPVHLGCDVEFLENDHRAFAERFAVNGKCQYDCTAYRQPVVCGLVFFEFLAAVRCERQ